MLPVGFIGVGNLGSSLINGFIKNSSDKIWLTKKNLTEQKEWNNFPQVVYSTKKELLKNCSIIVVSVKPYQLDALLKEITPLLQDNKHIILSSVSGVSLNDWKQKINKSIPVFRIMPNTAADVSQSFTCYSYALENEKYLPEVIKILNIFGKSLPIDDAIMDAATVLGACGLAFVFRFIRSMVQGGIQIGFDSKSAEKIVLQVLTGAVSLLRENQSHPEQEIDKVTTPKGCTITGLNEMEHQGFSAALIKGIEASYQSLSIK